MTYNLHPIFVHFPIAFLLLYSVIKILPLNKWFPRVSWRQAETILLVIGVISAFFALSTGETAEHLVRPDRALVNMHAFFAGGATWLYGLLLIGELTRIIRPYVEKTSSVTFLAPVVKFIEKVLTNRAVSILLAVLGVIALSLAGLLGGVLVYGTSADPFATTVLKLLGL